MGKKFSEFSSDKKTGGQMSFFEGSTGKEPPKKPDEAEIHKKISKESEENITKKYNEYSQMNSDQLMSEFLRMSRQRVADGSLDALEMQRVQETLFPYLSAEQQEKFRELMSLVGK